jgi:hypothetical protein
MSICVYIQYMVYNCVYYCDTCYIPSHTETVLSPLAEHTFAVLGCQQTAFTLYVYIGVVSVYMQYMVYNCVYYCDNCVYYCDTCYIPVHMPP